jgi:glycosyltransferase involved in cell wall biosynthesis
MPVYNEPSDVILQQIADFNTLREQIPKSELIIIDDHSTPPLSVTPILKNKKITLLTNDRNYGYGASLKKGIEAAQHDIVAIIDCDGSYTMSDLLQLYINLNASDMIIGTRPFKFGQEGLPRFVIKRLVMGFAEILFITQFPDINSGLRLFKKRLALPLLTLCSDRFSFTSSLSILFYLKHFTINWYPIDYHKRIGHSKFLPVIDTYKMIATILRLKFRVNLP